MAKAKETSTTKISKTTKSTVKEKQAFEKADARKTPPLAGLQVKKEQPPSDHEDSKTADEAMRKMFGSSDRDFAHGLFRQLNVASLADGKSSELYLNFSASVLRGVQPRDPLESMLVAQMATIHKMMFDLTLELAQCRTAARSNEIVSAINKLARTYTIQLDALKRYRSKGEQQVTVQNVTVGQGGQAIVGDVHQQKREDARASVSPAALTHSTELPMQSLAEVPKDTVMAKRPSRK
jgi:hypothetical protein